MKKSRKSKNEPAPSPKKNILPRVALALATLLLVLIAAEIACRWQFKKNVDALRFTESDLYYYYDRAGYRHNLPNKTGYERLWNDQGRAEFRINSLGFRGPEIETQKKPGDFRILFLGDSITLGGRLPEDVTFVSRVRQALAPRDGKRFEVANAGVGDVGLYEEEQTLHGNGIGIHPDLIVLCWYLNDARPPVGFPEEVVYKNPAIRWFNRQDWLRKSYLAGFLYDRLRQSIVARQMRLTAADDHRFDWTQDYMRGAWARDPGAFENLVYLSRFDWGDAWNDGSIRWMARKIVSLRDFAAKHHARFAVVMLPVHAQVYAGFDAPLIDKPQLVLGELLSQAGIPALNLLEILKPYARAHPMDRIFYDQCHYTPDGNGIVAQAILKFLRSSKLVD